MTDNVNQTSISLFFRLYKEHIKPYWRKILLALACMILVSGSTAFSAWIIQPALDKIFYEKDPHFLAILPGIMIMFSVVKGIASYFQNLIMKKLGQRIITDLQIRLYKHLICADMSFLNKSSSGKLISRFTNDINIMRGSVSNMFTGIARELFTVIMLVGLMIYQSVILSIIALIIFPLAIYPVMRLAKKMRKISNQTQEQMGKYTARLDESFQSIRVIKSYRGEKMEISRASEIAETIYRLYERSARSEFMTSPIMETLGGLAIAGVIWYGGAQIIAGETTPGTLFSFIMAFVGAYKPLKNLSDLSSSLQEGLAATNRLFNVLDVAPEIVDAPDAEPLEMKEGGSILVDQVTFGYNHSSKASKPALNALNLKIPAGKTVALVGPSGGGKSTISNLIPRFYDVQSGSISIDGQDIRQVKITSLRDEVTLVTQEVMLFDDTIANNIGFGKNMQCSQEEIEEAAKAAFAHDFIVAFPEGYNTMIGQHGFKLSGGQRQRISLARAFLKNSQIMVLDEATSALDAISELQVQRNLERLRAGKTTIVIAHRLSTIENADLIYVIKNGAAAESGTHKELMSRDSFYRKLYNREVGD